MFAAAHRACISVALLCLLFCSPSAGQILPKAEIAKLGKASTALVELQDKKAYGSAFCIHSSGLFITTAHGIPAQGGSVTLVMNSGLKTQKIFKAKVVRRDGELDLALLRVEGTDKLSALALGSAEDLEELMELVAFGYPFGTALAAKKGEYPAISVNVGSVTSLRRKEGELFRIQLDAALNPGNSGGPVLDRKGRVVGVVVSGVLGSGVNLAIPVSHVSRFVAKPDIQFTPPVVKHANMHKPVQFQARAVSVLPSKIPLTLELILSTRKGEERKHEMELANGSHNVTAVPIIPPDGPRVVRLEVKYADGSLSGTVTDRDLKIAGKTVKLSQVRSLRFGPKAQAVLYGGETLEGDLSGLPVVSVRLGGQAVRADLAKAVEVNVDIPGDVHSVSCTFVALQAGKEVARLSHTLYVEGSRAGLIAHWRFDERDGDVANDSVGKNAAILHNWKTGQDKWVQGKLGGAIAFSHPNNYLRTVSPIPLNELTITFWSKLLGRNNTVPRVHPRIIGPAAGHLGFIQYAKGIGLPPESSKVYAPKKPVVDTWEHYAIVFDMVGFARVYRDGKEVASGKVASSYLVDVRRFFGDAPWIMGHSESVGLRVDSWDGLLDDIRIYDRLLKPEEIAALAKGTLP